MQRSAFTLVASLFAVSTSATEPPKSGEDKVTIDYVVTSLSSVGPAHRDDPTAMKVEFAGVSHDEAGRFDKLGVRCVGLSELAGDSGHCTATDSSGDSLQFVYRSPAPGGKLGSSRLSLTGGSGKFAGFAGDAEGETEIVGSTAGLPFYLTRQKLTWRFSPHRAQAAAASR